MPPLRPEITGRANGDEPMGVSPRQTGQLLNIGQTRVWGLIGSGELETYREGRSRKVTMRSIRARHERQLADARQADAATAAAQPRRRPCTEARLAELSRDQVAGVIAALRRIQPKYPQVTEELVQLLAGVPR